MLQSVYFCRQDEWELRPHNDRYDPQLPLERSEEPFLFKSGGAYLGEWRGPFRDGYGTM